MCAKRDYHLDPRKLARWFATDFPSYGKSRKPETFLGSNSLVSNALRMAFSLHLPTADLATGDDIENPTDLRETRDSDLLVR
jgi:hypothetical protein